MKFILDILETLGYVQEHGGMLVFGTVMIMQQRHLRVDLDNHLAIFHGGSKNGKN